MSTENNTAPAVTERASKAELIGWTGFIDDAHVAALPLPPAPPNAAERKRGVKRQKGQGLAKYFERLADGNSLALAVSHTGSKTWEVVFYVDADKLGKRGKPVKVPRFKMLGKFPALNYLTARKKAARFNVEEAQQAEKERRTTARAVK